MFITAETSITIKAPADAVWDYASPPANWTASNPTEHFGLRFSSQDNLPHEGAEFDQQESVAGVYANLHGRFHFMDRPHLAFWSGVATYRLAGGVMRVRVPEGGVLRLDETEHGVRMAHNVFMQFPDSLWGAFCRWFFVTRLNGPSAVYEHTYRELVYFKRKLEATFASRAEIA